MDWILGVIILLLLFAVAILNMKISDLVDKIEANEVRTKDLREEHWSLYDRVCCLGATLDLRWVERTSRSWEKKE
jgi:hypothetical protein